jgi:hypothetical protein
MSHAGRRICGWANDFATRKGHQSVPFSVSVRNPSTVRRVARSATPARPRAARAPARPRLCPAPAAALPGPCPTPAGTLPRPAAARLFPGRSSASIPLARGGRLACGRRPGRFAAPCGGAAALPAALLCGCLVGLPASARARFASPARYRVLGGPGATLRLAPGHALVLIALFDMPSLTPLFGGVGRLVTTRHDPLPS